MKLTKWESVFLAAAAAAVLFTCGYFAGRSSGGRVDVTVENTTYDRTLPQDADTGREKLVDINSATAAELATLPGIGEVLAGRIIEYRNENGAFLYKEELMNVQGIGEKVFDSAAPYITCG